MFDFTGLPWTSIAFFPVFGVLVIFASVALAAGVRAARQRRNETRDRALRVAVVFVGLAAVWPVLVVVLTPIGAD